VDDTAKPAESKQESKPADTVIVQPAASAPQQPPTRTDTGSAQSNPQPTEPIRVRLVGGGDLEPFEAQTIEIARETLGITRRTYWIAIFGFLTALAAAVFVGTQVYEMTCQTQILASQNESAAAGALFDQMNTRKQLAIVEKQATSQERQVDVLAKAFEASERPYLGVQKVDFTEEESNRIMHVVINFKNFGANTAQELRLWYTTTAKGQVRGGYNMLLGRQGGVLLPGNVRRLPAAINAVDFAGLHAGSGQCAVQVTALYKWNKKQYQYCEVWSYNNETKSFEPVDACKPAISKGRYPGDTAVMPQYPN
jgi:hypothetical protein